MAHIATPIERQQVPARQAIATNSTEPLRCGDVVRWNAAWCTAAEAADEFFVIETADDWECVRVSGVAPITPGSIFHGKHTPKAIMLDFVRHDPVAALAFNPPAALASAIQGKRRRR